MIDTDLFSFEEASTSAAWIAEFEDWSNEVDADEDHEEHHHHDHDDDDEDEHEHHHEHEEHEHHHHHHHHHHEHGVDENDDEGTADEYDIQTFVYYRRRPFNRAKFDKWVETNGFNIIRAKGICYFLEEKDKIYIYESAGRQRTLTYNGQWYSERLTKKQLAYLIRNNLPT